MKQCPFCKAFVSGDAGVCPQCLEDISGADAERAEPRRSQLGGATLLSGAVLTIFGALGVTRTHGDFYFGGAIPFTAALVVGLILIIAGAISIQ